MHRTGHGHRKPPIVALLEPELTERVSIAGLDTTENAAFPAFAEWLALAHDYVTYGEFDGRHEGRTKAYVGNAGGIH